MHGMFNRGLQFFVRDIFGAETWEQTCIAAELPFFNFETMLKYEDGVTDQVIDALVSVLGRPRGELLEDFGTYLVSEDHLASVRRLLRFGGETYEQFLHSLEDIHDRAKMAIPDLDLPHLRLTSLGDGRYTLHYRFVKHGYGGVFLGMLRAMADDYGALVLIEHRPSVEGEFDTDVFEISLLQHGNQPNVPSFSTANSAIIQLPIALDIAMLDVLMPLHLQITQPGNICHVGPTFMRLVNGQNILGENIFDLLEFSRPIDLSSWSKLVASAGDEIIARLSVLPEHNLKAVVVPIASSDKVIIDFSLGAGVHEIVAAKNLNRSSFSPADQTIEMLYLKEVQFVVLSNALDLSTRLDGAKKTAETQAYTDSLTGLHNRRALIGFIRRLQDRNAENGFAVMQIDLDFFKSVNDTHGHAAGDFVLQEIAKMLQYETRKTDMVARIGGDEFVVVLSDFGSKQQLQEIARRIVEKAGQPFVFNQQKCLIGASIGATIASHDTEKSVDDLLAEADAALYCSKEMGRGMFNLFALD